MQWYPFFEADYLRDTLHLTWLEDLAYRRLLDLCYRNGGHVTADKELLYRLVRATEPDQQKAVDKVLDEFFFSRGRVKVNRRASEELLKAKRIHDSRVRGGKERHKRAAQAQVSSSPADTVTVTSTTTSTSTKEAAERAAAAALTAFDSIGCQPFGSLHFQLIVVEEFQTTPFNGGVADAMERVIQRCKRKNIRVPGRWYAHKREIEKIEAHNTYKRTPL